MPTKNNPPSGLATMHPAIPDSKNYNNWIFNRIKPFLREPILEIGPGWGQFSAFLIGKGSSYYAIDTDYEVIKRLEKIFPKYSRHFINADIRSPLFSNNFTEKPRSLLMLNVLEHIEDDCEFLKKLREIFPETGIVLQVPAMPSIYGTLDKQAGHFRRYSAKNLKETLESAGYKISHLSYFNAVGAITWFISGKILHLKITGKKTGGLIHLNDKILIPVSKALEFILRPFMGQSLIISAD